MPYNRKSLTGEYESYDVEGSRKSSLELFTSNPTSLQIAKPNVSSLSVLQEQVSSIKLLNEQVTSLSLHKNSLTSLALHDFKPSSLAIHKGQQSSLAIHEGQQSSLAVHKGQQTSLALHKGQQSSLAIHKGQQSSLTIHEGRQSSLAVHSRSVSSLSVHKRTISSLGLYKGQQSSLGIYQGKQSSLPIHKGEQSSLPIYKGEQSSLAVYKGQQSSLGIHSGKQSSLAIYKGEQSSLGIYEGRQSSLAIHEGRQSSLAIHKGQQSSLAIHSRTVSSLSLHKSSITSLALHKGQQSSLSVHEGKQSSLSIHKGQQSSLAIHEGIQNSLAIYEGQQSSLSIHEGRQSSLGIYKGQQSSLSVHSRTVSSLPIHKRTISSLKLHEGQQSSLALHKGQQSSFSVHSGKQSSLGIYKGQQSSLSVYTGKQSSLGLYKGQQSSLGIYKGQQSSLAIHEGEQSSLAIHQGKQSSLAVYKGELSSLAVYKGQQSSLAIYKGQQSSLGIYKGQQNSLGIYKGEQSSLAIHEGRQSSLAIYEGQQSSLSVYTGKQSSLGLYKGQQSSLGIYKGEQSSLGLYKGEQSSLGIYKGQQSSVGLYKGNISSLPLHKGQLSSIPLHKEQLSSLSLHKAQLSSVLLHKDKVSSLNIYKSKPVTISVFNPKNAGMNTIRTLKSPTIIEAEKASFNKVYNTVNPGASITIDNSYGKNSIDYGSYGSKTRFPYVLVTPFVSMTSSVSFSYDNNDYLLEGGRSKSGFGQLHVGLSNDDPSWDAIPTIASVQSAKAVSLNGYGTYKDFYISNVLLYTTVCYSDGNLDDITPTIFLNGEAGEESSIVFSKMDSFFFGDVNSDFFYLALTGMNSTDSSLFGSVCYFVRANQIYHNNSVPVYNLRSPLSWNNSQDDIEPTSTLVEDGLSGISPTKISGGNIYATQLKNTDAFYNANQQLVAQDRMLKRVLEGNVSSEFEYVFANDIVKLYLNDWAVRFIVKGDDGYNDYVEEFKNNTEENDMSNLKKVICLIDEPNYQSFSLIYQDTNLYVAFRKYKEFEGGFLLDDKQKELWNIFIYEPDFEFSFPERTFADNRETDFRPLPSNNNDHPVDWYGNTEGKKVFYNVFVGTRDLLHRVKDNWWGWGNYGGTDLIPVLQKSFDRSIVSSSVHGINASLSSSVLPLFYPGYIVGFKRKGITGQHYENLWSDGDDYGWWSVQGDNFEKTLWGEFYYPVENPPSEAQKISLCGLTDYADCIDKSGGQSFPYYVNGILFESPTVTEVPDTLPQTLKEKFGVDLVSSYLSPGKIYYSINGKHVVPKNGNLYESIPGYPLTPAATKVLIQGEGDYKVYGNLILNYTSKVTKVYGFNSTSGIQMITTVPGSLISNIGNVEGDYYFVTCTSDSSSDIIYIFRSNRDGVMKVYEMNMASVSVEDAYIGVIGENHHILVTTDNSSYYLNFEIGKGISGSAGNFRADGYTSIKMIRTGMAGSLKCCFRGYKDDSWEIFTVTEGITKPYDFTVQNMNLSKEDQQFIIDKVQVEVEKQSGSDLALKVFGDNTEIYDSGVTTISDAYEVKEFDVGMQSVDSIKVEIYSTDVQINDIKVMGRYIPK